MTPELQEIAEANNFDQVVPAMLAHASQGWILIIAERHSDGVLRHVDFMSNDVDRSVGVMLRNLHGASPEGKVEFEEMLSKVRGDVIQSESSS